MHRKIPIENPVLFNKLCGLSNISKFKIIELTQNKEMGITLLAKKVNLAFNKCSNYCTELENMGLILKKRKGKNVLIKSKINIGKLDSILS